MMISGKLSLSLIIIILSCSQQQQLVIAANHRPSPSPAASPADLSSSRRPTTSLAVILGLLTAIFSLTFILLILYIKHCNNNQHITTTRPPHYSGARTNSGIDRGLIGSLPVFRFNNNNKLQVLLQMEQCAVCLTPFDAADILRLLPKCNHAFHVECVDTWLDTHSTCPLCRFTVHADDLQIPTLEHDDRPPEGHRRVSGRNSSAGEQQKSCLIKTSSEWAISFRRSLDDGAANFKKMKTAAQSSSFRSGGARKDGLLLLTTEQRRQRWSDVQPSSHLLYLRSQMLLQTDSAVINAPSLSDFTGFPRFQLPSTTS